MEVSEARWSAQQSRGIRWRLVVEGTLMLQTPAHFGNGDTDDFTDMPLLRDTYEPEKPLLTGASIAGALRSYLCRCEGSINAAEVTGTYAELLFGGVKGDDEGSQSPLVVDDVLGSAMAVERRDGVRLDRASRTAADRALFSMEMWPAGTTFDLRFELLFSDGGVRGVLEAMQQRVLCKWAQALKRAQAAEAGPKQDVEKECKGYRAALSSPVSVYALVYEAWRSLLADQKVGPDATDQILVPALDRLLGDALANQRQSDAWLQASAAIECALKQALATALAGLSDGGITLGARKRRGYGSVKAAQWRARIYNLCEDPKDLVSWVRDGARPLRDVPGIQCDDDVKQVLGNPTPLTDRRQEFTITATFWLNGSLLIRSGAGTDKASPDMVHLHARQPDGTMKPVLSGTSLAGALRARAFKIANTLAAGNDAKALELVEGIFGPDLNRKPRPQPHASRLAVSESVICESQDKLVQSRVSIDRFTGGTRDGALFNEQPAFGGRVKIWLRLDDPKDHEAGLLLLLLKDLWTGDLPLGGESSVGRGRLQGEGAALTWATETGARKEWKLVTQNPENPASVQVQGGEASTLSGWVTQLATALAGSNASTKEVAP